MSMSWQRMIGFLGKLRNLFLQQRKNQGVLLVETVKERNIQLILNLCEEHGLYLNTQKAYILATVEHETNDTFLPVKEAYWLSENWRRRNLRYYPYYGRGFVQLTWEYNYKKYSDILDMDLVNNPDMVMEPRISAYILVHGFKYGVFTGRVIERYINDGLTDFYNARRCINGTDRADRIADLADKWLKRLESNDYKI